MIRKTLIFYLAIMCLLVYSAGAALMEEGKGEQYPVSITIVAGSDSQTAGVKPGEYFKVVLSAAGGTGYSWQLDNKNMDLVELVAQTADSVNKNPHWVGGEVRWEIYFKVKPDASGQENLRFWLRRGESGPPAREFLLTVITD